jgi:hypothetical protein
MYVGLQRDPTPRDVPIAAVGADLAGQVSAALGDAVTVTTVADANAGDVLLAGHDVIAVVARTSPTVLALNVAGSSGPSTVGAVESLIRVYGRSTGSEVSIKDVNPLVRFDNRGTVGFYVAFGVSLASFILAQMMMTSTAFVRSRHHLTATALFAALVGLMASFLAGPILGALPGSVISLSFTLALLSAATALATIALGAWFGAVGVPIATLLLITVGNSTSGATVGADLLPGYARVLSEVLPPGAAVASITDVSYFGGAHQWADWSVLLVWIVVAAGLIVIKRHRSANAGADVERRSIR